MSHLRSDLIHLSGFALQGILTSPVMHTGLNSQQVATLSVNHAKEVLKAIELENPNKAVVVAEVTKEEKKK